MLFAKTIQPTRGLVLVEVAPEDRKTPSGLHLAGNKNPSPDAIERAGSFLGHIVAIGPPAMTDAGVEIPLDGLECGQLVVVRMGLGATLHLIDHRHFFLCPFGAIGGIVLDVEPESVEETETAPEPAGATPLNPNP